MATGFKLMDAFRSQIKKIKCAGIDSRSSFDIGYPTGFLALDFLNGTMIHVKNEEMDYCYNSIGLVDGSANMFVGSPGSGKSTLVVQISANIVRQFPASQLFIDDIESSLPIYRKEQLIQVAGENFEDKIDIRNTGITTENVYQRIRAIHDLKMEHRAELEYDTGLYDTRGNRIFKLQPTVYVIDSFAFLLPEEVMDEDEIKTGMTAAGVAKLNTLLVKKIVQLIKEANIIINTVNHENPEINIGFIAKRNQVTGLNEQRIPGGQAALYLANNLFELHQTKSLKADKEYGIDGSVIEVKVIKSRSNKNNRSLPMIFNKNEGLFDNELSMYHIIKESGHIGGAGSYMYLDNLPDHKFAQKDFKSKLESDVELQKAFAQLSYEVLSPLLSDTMIEDEEDNKEEKKPSFDLNSLVLGNNSPVFA